MEKWSVIVTAQPKIKAQKKQNVCLLLISGMHVFWKHYGFHLLWHIF